ncbi:MULTISPECIES: SchA/CurD-like domain-containing protein [Nonomuraea]|uniref:SchA/CurD-like domain-containing protein n=1 Tax=Nonomuraea helvata TaxID=37484 RepID=A0ABV5S335_9ACTN
MPYAAITYNVRPGFDDEIAEIFADFQRVDTPILRDATGDQAGRLLGTAVFLKDGVLVRVIHYEGDFRAVAAHMAGQKGVHVIEEKLAPYLVDQRDTSTPEAFQAYFRNALMRCVVQLSVDTHPAGR